MIVSYSLASDLAMVGVIFWTNQPGIKMNVLIQIKDHTADKELKDFNESMGNTVYFTRSSEESISVLNAIDIQKAMVNLKGLSDAAILKYMTDYYPGTEVVILTSKGFDNLLSLFRGSNYSVIYEPLRITDLKSKMPAGKNLA